jgi:tripartite-type tricarboxylate transporter receptor subunit TctC
MNAPARLLFPRASQNGRAARAGFCSTVMAHGQAKGVSPMGRLSRRSAAALAFVGHLTIQSTQAHAAFPERPIKVIVPFPAGGAVDLIARLVTARITQETGWSFVIESKAGAGGILATDATAKAAPDGYTLLLTTPNHTINAALKSNLPYDTERDLIPLSVVAEVPELLVSHPSAPFDTFAGFVAHAKANPGKLNYSSAGNGTLPHVTMELLLKLASLKVVHVPYRGATPAMTDLLAGVVQLKFDTYATANEMVAAGKLRALAFASTTRSKQMPQLPTIAEMGYPGYEGVLWNGLMAPAGTPKAIVDQLAAASISAARSPALGERLMRDGIDPVGSTQAAFAQRITREIGQWRELAKSVTISLD